MIKLTVLPPDELASRLKSLAKSPGLSINKLIEELSAQALASFDAETRFRTLAAWGDPPTAIKILDRLDEGMAGRH